MKKLIVLLTAAALILGCIGCSKKTETAEEAVSNFLTAITTQNSETAQQYVSSLDEIPFLSVDSTNSEGYYMTESILSSLAFEILSSEETNSSAVVNVKITAVDMSAVVSDYFSIALELAFSGLEGLDLETKMEEAFMEAFDNNKHTLREAEVSIQLDKNSTGWNIPQIDDALLDALSGGLSSIASNLSNSFAE